MRWAKAAYAVAARQRDRAGVAKWTASLAYLHGRFKHGEPVDWAVYEGAKERLRGLLEARVKALALKARLRELEEGERPTAYFFKASWARWDASAIVGLRRADGTLAEGPAMLAVAEAYYAELFSRQACDPAAEAYLLDCVSACLGGEEARSMEADVTLEEVREALLSLRDSRAPGHDRLPKEFYAAFWHLLRPDLLEVYRALLERERPLTGIRVNGFLSGVVEQAGGVRQGCPLSPLLYILFIEPFAGLVCRDPVFGSRGRRARS
ncbi:hypothetical protein AAFF_G00191640 [Aldrovandia affinis]|uniref:Reverse transcriptase domain-containing protein n=1 Tax=Aldrovandia affinis TaxID=143900 RepID=A0AAD7RJS7_9TELE|nr:hypothetical protein AAFF_G00191640 [Aldrovandia affinis]